MNHFTSRLLPRTALAWPAAAGTLLVGSCLCWSVPARADTALAAEVSYDDAIDSNASGIGFDVLFGPRFDLTLLTLGTEIGGGFAAMSGRLDPTVYRGVVGARLGLGAIVRPSIFAHIGLGYMRYDTLGDREGRAGFASDVGAAIDFTVLPLMNLGASFSYNNVAGSNSQPAFDWLGFGAHAVFVF